MPLQKINLKTQSQWTNTDIDNALNLKANDNAVVHNSWDETISWVKTFNGNIWIGTTTNPTEKLEVNGDILSQWGSWLSNIRLWADWDKNIEFRNSDWSDPTSITRPSWTKDLWYYNWWYQFYIKDWGNVWIWTTAPTEKLEVNGNTVITWAKVNVANIPTSDPSVAWDLWNDSGTVKISAW